jgi:YD repeat-containing protein
MNKPAARQGDLTRKGGPIVQGSATVFIGSGGGVACSVCPGAPTEGNPVNPVLGAKVLSAETDLALPGPLPLRISREYSSYQTPTPAPVGLLGPGWWLPGELDLQVTHEQLLLHDGRGRSIHFPALQPGEVAFSASERLWLVRGGLAQLQRAGHPQRLAPAYAALPSELRLDAGIVLATASPLQPWWVFGPELDAGRQAQGQESSAPGAPPRGPLQQGRHVLLGRVDRLGCQHRVFYHQKGPFQGRIDTLTDGAGRRYQLQLQRVCAAQEAAHGWGADCGIRLVAVHLRSDPFFGADLPQQPLVRYTYSRRGELQAVHGRDGKELRHFLYDPLHPGRMAGHRHAGRPTSRYTYDRQGRVIEQHNPEGLDYRFDYSDFVDPGASADAGEPAGPQPSTLVTDSLGRQRRYLFTGEGGLRRIACLIEADGSRHRLRHDGAGRLMETTDPLGRTTTYQRDTANGDIVGITDSAGRSTVLEYNRHGQIVRSVAPAPDGSAAQQQWSYDPQGRLLLYTDALGHGTQYHYPEPAQANGQAADAATGGQPSPPHLPHLPIAITDAKGGRQQLQWDARGLLTHHQDCSGRCTRYGHDAWGNRVSIHTEEGGQLTLAYDSASRPVASTDALGRTTRYGYSEAGDLERIEHPGGHLEQFVRDAWGRSTGYSHGSQGRYLHQRHLRDRAGRLIELHNENASVHRLRYDSQDRVVEETGFDGSTRHFEYNAAGQITASGDALHLTRYHYHEPSGLLVQRSTTAVAQDKAPAQPSSTDPAAQSITEHFEYDQAGNLCGTYHRVQGGYGLVARLQRDRMGRIHAESQHMHNPQDRWIWRHRSRRLLDPLGQATQSIIDGLPDLQWLHYGAGHLHGLLLGGHTALEVQRDGLHRETQRRFGATTVERSYDRLSRPQETRLRRNTALLRGEAAAHAAHHPPAGPAPETLNRRHHYNALGQLSGLHTAQGPLAYGYDHAGRLIQAEAAGLQQRWQYDPAGNRLFAHQQGQDAARNWSEEVRQNLHDPDFNLLQADPQGRDRNGQPCWPANRILRDDHHRYRYDKAGNLRERAGAQQTDHYHWDHANRLVGHSVRKTAGAQPPGQEPPGEEQTSRCFHDVFGRLIARQLGAAEDAPMVFYGWEGDRLTLTQLPAQDGQPVQRIHTLYEPDSFVPLLRVQTGKQAREPRLTDLWEQDNGQALDEQQKHLFDDMQQQIMDETTSEQTRQALAGFGLNADELRQKLLPPATPITHIHLYHCDHLGTPQALIDPLGQVDWQMEVDP